MAVRRRCSFLIGLVALGAFAGGSDARADWPTVWHGWHVDYARTNAWPHPFGDVDARQTVAPFAIMKHNGWRTYNTIGHEFFRPGDAVLTAAGNHRVSWIAQHAPLDRRAVYVLRGATDEETRARVDAVESAVASLPQHGPRTAVFVTDVEPASAPGAWATTINRKWMSSLPAPQLPSTSASGTSGATGGAGGAGN